eukprot:6268296-Pyramimonas_sp.AAC.1
MPRAGHGGTGGGRDGAGQDGAGGGIPVGVEVRERGEAAAPGGSARLAARKLAARAPVLEPQAAHGAVPRYANK